MFPRQATQISEDRLTGKAPAADPDRKGLCSLWQLCSGREPVGNDEGCSQIPNE